MFEPLKQADLKELTGEAAEEGRRIYCGTVGADFMHLQEPERRAGSPTDWKLRRAKSINKKS